MGQTLSEPVIERRARDYPDLQNTKGQEFKPASIESRLSFFGVYDGHGGDRVALFAGENIHQIVAKQEAFQKGDIEQALKDGFLATDRAILMDPRYEEEVSGCTASVGIISHKKIYVEIREVWLGVKGRAKPLSFDHKPQNEGEKARINAAGGFVDFGRVNGNLALSRAIDVTVHDITDDDEFLVVACDGIWDCQSSQAVIEFVRRGIVAKQDLSKICENMMDNCLASNSETGGSGYDEIAKRVANGDGPCAPPEYAEFRGPGVHHNFDDSDSGYDVEMDKKIKSFEMFDHGEEDKDLASQVPKKDSPIPKSPIPMPYPKKNDPKEPKYQAVVEKVLPKTTDSKGKTLRRKRSSERTLSIFEIPLKDFEVKGKW
ncbi:hypothetical protein DID88_001856 [Monilinia fructigena]|uniref:PPM-type phosphatase domain-containing protein n=1 Tax=Monilinia fructigena TaxID=38457 RepID=A0A395IVR0_9HELO|nr:hypothetical protein DID88_001856 [Monilinia fructigena]